MRHTIKVKRTQPILSTVGTAALNALLDTGRTSDGQIISETEIEATVTFEWSPRAGEALDLDVVLARRGLKRIP